MNDVAVLPAEAPAGASALALIRPIASPTEMISFHEETTQLIEKALKKGIDFDVIPGTGSKPSLLKPGAERLSLAFAASPRYEVIEKEVDHNYDCRFTKRQKKWRNRDRNDKHFDWEVTEGSSLGLYRYVIRCRLERPDGRILGEGVGSCSSLETKYVDRPRDCENTILKMAKKRAHVDAVLTAFALSNRFTQDVEEMHDHSEPAEARRAEPPKAAATKAEQKTPSIFDKEDSGMQKTLAGLLKAQKVDESLWETIGDRLHGKPSTELKTVIAEVVKLAGQGA